VSLLAAITGLAQGGAPRVPPNIDRITADVKVLSSDRFEGRAPASPSEPKTIAYLVRQFSAAGLEPGGERDKAGRRGWTQNVPLAQSEISGRVAASIKTARSAKPLRQGEEIVIRSTFLPQEQVRITDAQLVFIGYGISAPERDWDDFKNADLRGKVGVVLVNDPDFETAPGRFNGKAMTYYGRWTYKYEEAARRGAVGLLVVHETAPAAYGWATVRNSNTLAMFDIERPNPADVHPLLEAWIQRDIAVALFQDSGLDFEAEKTNAQSAAFQPVVLADASLSVEFAVKHSRIVSKNVVAKLTGTRQPDETIMYTAHWDHLGVGPPDARGDRIYNGARDNALGVAGLLELARMYAAAPRLDRTVVFLSPTAEEKNLLGSEYYAQHPLYPLATTAGVYNMDGGSIHGPSWDVSIAGDGKVTLQVDLAAAASRQDRRFSPDPHPEAGSFFRSDHFPFAKVGVPAISFRAGQDLVKGGMPAGQAAYDEYVSTRYHQPADEWSSDWDLRGFALDLALLYSMGRDLAGSRRWPQWMEGSEFKSVRDATANSRK
jgi:Zn-dependent M28 family amino/carboxypeptidase